MKNTGRKGIKKRNWVWCPAVCLLSVLLVFFIIQKNAYAENNPIAESLPEGQNIVASFTGDDGINPLSIYEAEYGTPEDRLDLPDVLAAVSDTGENIEVPVTWRCTDDGFGGSAYVPEHENHAAEYTFEPILQEGYQYSGILPFVKVIYKTEKLPENNGRNTELSSEVYLNGASGDDLNDGLTKNTAVKTFEKAKELLAVDGTIYICGEVKVSGQTTWSLAGKGTAKIVRESGYRGLAAYLINVTLEDSSLTLENITIDGANISGSEGTGSMIRVSGGSYLFIHSGTVIQNSKSTAIEAHYGTIEMDGGMICNNQAASAAIELYDSSMKLSGGEITNNTSSGSAAGIYVDDWSNLQITDGKITNNVLNNAMTEEPRAAGIKCEGSFWMSGGEISGNEAPSGLAGGIYIDGLELEFLITGGTIKGNTAGGEHSGNNVYVSGASVLVLSGSVSIPDGLTLDQSDRAYGGFIVLEGEIDNPIGIQEVYGSPAAEAGMIVAWGEEGFNLTETEVQKFTYKDNAFIFELDSDQGTIMLKDPLAKVYLNGVSGSDANSGESAEAPVKTFEKARRLLAQNGTIYITGTVTVADTAVWTLEDRGNAKIVRGEGFNGKLAAVSGGLTLQSITLDGNKLAGAGALIEVSAGGRLTAKEGALLQNNKNCAVLISGGHFIMDGGKITGNTAGKGGAVYIAAGTSYFTMENGEISGNTADSGGAIYEAGYAGTETIEIKGGKIINNKAVGEDENITYGGAIYSNNILSITGGEISGNTVQNGRGGGVYKAGGSGGKFTMSGGTIKKNKARAVNGGSNIYLNDAQMFISGNANIPDGFTINHSKGKLFISGKLNYPVGIEELYSNPQEGMEVASGTGAYLLTKDDMLMFSYKGDAFGYDLDAENNRILLAPRGYAEVYLDGLLGSDSNSGSTPSKAVYTFEKAKAQLRKDGVIYILGTVSVFEEKTWSLPEETYGTAKVMRYAGFDKELISIDSQFGYMPDASLTLEHITIDGGAIWAEGVVSRESNTGIEAVRPLIFVTGQLTIGDGAVLQNNASHYEFANEGFMGGAVQVNDYGRLDLNGGSIRYNLASGDTNGGGGVYLLNNGFGSPDPVFNMNSGDITGNVAYSGGGVHVNSSTVFNMSGGEIKDNISTITDSSTQGGGGVFVSGKFTMSGGTITGNKASGIINASGGTQIPYFDQGYGNGGGVLITNNGQMSVKGSAIITGNTRSGTVNNLALASRKQFKITGQLSGNIGISLQMHGLSTDYPKLTEGVVIAGADSYTVQEADAAKLHADLTEMRKGYDVELDAPNNQVLLTYPGGKVTVDVQKDGEAWIDVAPAITLHKDNESWENEETLAAGTYVIFAGNRDTGKTVTVKNKAVYETVDYYTVTFYDGEKAYGEGKFSSQLVMEGDKVNEPISEPEKLGYVFSKWVTSDGGDEAFDFESGISGTTSIYASWTEKPKRMITLADGGKGTAKASYSKAIEGTEIEITAEPKKGYQFVKWTVVEGNIELSDTQALTTTFVMADEDVKIETVFESTDSTLSGLSISSGILSPVFDPDTLHYDAEVDSTVSEITVIPLGTVPDVKIKVNDTLITDSEQGAAVSLKVGENRIRITVTAEDGSATAYTLTVKRAKGSALVKSEQDSGTPEITLGKDQEQTIKDAVLTEADYRKMDEGKNMTIYLQIKAVTPDEADKNMIEGGLDGQSLGLYLDIALFKQAEGEPAEAVTVLREKLRLTIDIPENLRAAGRVFTVLRLHDGQLTVLPDLDDNPDTITFETDRFSIYALAYKDNVQESETDAADKPVQPNPPTGDHMPVWPFYTGFASLILIAALAAFRGKKH